MTRGAVVLCGGASRRMGRDKAALAFGDTTLLGRVLRNLEGVVDETIVAAGPGQALPPLPAGTRVVQDPVPDQGPLVGLASGLRAATASTVFATAVDAPFVRAGVVRLLFERLGDADAAVVEADGRVHPLLAVYRRDVHRAADGLVAEGERRLRSLLDAIVVHPVQAAALRAVDPDLLCLTNVNTPDAYRDARP